MVGCHLAGHCLDLLQVDLLASGASLFWSRSARPRATKSREVPRHMKSDEGLFESLGIAFFGLKKNGMCRLRGCGFQAGLDSKTGFTIYYSRLPITRHLLGKFKYWESSSYREFKAKNRKKETNEMGRRWSSSIIHTIGPYYTLHFKDSKRYVDL